MVMSRAARRIASRAVAAADLVAAAACTAALLLPGCAGAPPPAPAPPPQSSPPPPSTQPAAFPEGLEYQPPAPGTYSLPPIGPATDGAVVDDHGVPRHLFDYLGDRYVLLSFIYTHCTESEGCPLATGVLMMVKEALTSEPDLATRVRLISLSFDPDRDTPAAMRQYALHGRLDDPDSRWQSRTWSFLTTASRHDLDPILEGYGQSVVREIDAKGRPTGDFSHVLKVFLIDRRRRVRNIYSTAFLHPAVAINDLKTLWLEDGRP